MAHPEEQAAQILRDAGCQEEFIAHFLHVMAEGTPQERDRLLEQERQCILNKLHDEQEKLECFDYLRYQLKKDRRDPQ